MINIIWANEANEQYFKVIKYLHAEWGERVAQEFEDRIIKAEEQITAGLIKFPASNKLGFEKCKVDRYNTIIFQRKEAHIEVSALIDTRSDHPY